MDSIYKNLLKKIKMLRTVQRIPKLGNLTDTLYTYIIYIHTYMYTVMNVICNSSTCIIPKEEGKAIVLYQMTLIIILSEVEA